MKEEKTLRKKGKEREREKEELAEGESIIMKGRTGVEGRVRGNKETVETIDGKR